MSDDQDQDLKAWVAVFQESQRQMVDAHVAFQNALAQSHREFMTAMAESQQQLAQVLRGHLGPEELAELVGEVSANTQPTTTNRSLRRRIPVAVEARLDHDLPPQHRKWALTRDGQGLAEFVVALLPDYGAHGRIVSSWGEVEPDEGLVELSGIRQFNTLDDAGSLVVRIANRAIKYGATRGKSPTLLIQDTLGRFGLDACDSHKAFLGGMRGVAVAMSRDGSPARCIDLDVGHRLSADVAPILVEEMLYGTGLSVGRPDEERVALTWMEVDGGAESFLKRGPVVVTTPVSPRFREVVIEFCRGLAEPVILVGDEDPMMQAALQAVGLEVKLIHHNEITDLVADLQVAVHGQRVTAVLHANDRAWGRGELEGAYSHRIAMLQIIMAATAAYGVELTAFLIAEDSGWSGAVFDEILRRHAHAETQRQSEDGVTRALIVAPDVEVSDVIRELTTGTEPETLLAIE